MTAAPLAVTAGEPAGVGPELLIRLAEARESDSWVAVADPDVMRRAAQRLGSSVTIHSVDAKPRRGRLRVWPVMLGAKTETPGAVQLEHADYVMGCLDAALDGALAGTFTGMVTGPLHKASVIEGGFPGFSGHTEYLAQRCAVDQVVMMLAAGSLRVALATTHLPLRAVPDALTGELLTDSLTVLQGDLGRWFGCPEPKILVAGLNPHAGEGGHLGTEDDAVIRPVCDRFRAAGANVVGPLPADTLFTPDSLRGADAVLAMYHDQGLPVLKYAGFGKAVNITLGLPVVRTSVDHGTALDIAGQGRADPGSLLAAFDLAVQVAAGTVPR